MKGEKFHQALCTLTGDPNTYVQREKMSDGSVLITVGWGATGFKRVRAHISALWLRSAESTIEEVILAITPLVLEQNNRK